MKVKELIKKLQKLDQEAEVLTYDSEWDTYFHIGEPKYIGRAEIKRHFTGEVEIIEKAVQI